MGFDETRVGAVTDMWDEFIEGWMDGDPPDSGALAPWFRSYAGRGDAAPVAEALPEPYHGGTSATPALCYFALNPGQPFLGRPQDLWYSRHPMSDLQSRSGLFAEEIRSAGGYRAWVRDGIDWTQWAPTPNKFFVVRHRFAEAWLDRDLAPGEVLGVEFWPWHSARFDKNQFRPGLSALDQIEQYVLGFVDALGVRQVFTFGAAWFRILERIGFGEIGAISTETDQWEHMPRNRTVRLLQRGQLTVIAEAHSGSAAPPKASEVASLRELIDERLATRG